MLRIMPTASNFTRTPCAGIPTMTRPAKTCASRRSVCRTSRTRTKIRIRTRTRIRIRTKKTRTNRTRTRIRTKIRIRIKTRTRRISNSNLKTRAKKQQPQNQQQGGISKQNAEKILKAMENEENSTRARIDAEKEKERRSLAASCHQSLVNRSFHIAQTDFRMKRFILSILLIALTAAVSLHAQVTLYRQASEPGLRGTALSGDIPSDQRGGLRPESVADQRLHASLWPLRLHIAELSGGQRQSIVNLRNRIYLLL